MLNIRLTSRAISLSEHSSISISDNMYSAKISVALQPTCPTQPENVDVLWFYGLHSNAIGTYIKKPMNECTGEEILKKFLYYCDLEDKMDGLRVTLYLRLKQVSEQP